MRPFGLFDRRVRGFRVVELGALGVLLILILTVYLAKTGAGGKRADIDRIQHQIFDEQAQIRLLRAEVATLEQPERLAALSVRYLGLRPISARREVTAQGLQDVARIAVVDHKSSLVTNDPLTQAGSPDLATVPSAAAPAAPAEPAEAPPGAPAKPVAKPANVASTPRPITLAQAGPTARPGAHGPKAASASSIDALLQNGAAGSAR